MRQISVKLQQFKFSEDLLFIGIELAQNPDLAANLTFNAVC
jgi:hypothetical protein